MTDSSSRLRVVVHIGPMKTGTTALASFLSRSARAGRLPAGFVYPVDELWWPKDGQIVKHHALTTVGILNDKPEGRDRQQRQREEVIERLSTLSAVVRAKNQTDTTVLLIAEAASRHADPQLLTAELLRHFDEVVYCLVTRGQIHAHASAHSHVVKGPIGLRRKASLTQRLLRPFRDVGRFDYARHFRRWGGLENARLVVVPFLERDIASYALIDRVLEATGLTLPPREAGIDGKRIHPALDAVALRRLRILRFLIALSRPIPALSARILDRFELEKAAAQSRARDGAGEFQAWGYGERRQERLRRAYADSNRRLAEMLGDVSRQPLWAEWFAEQRPRRGRLTRALADAREGPDVPTAGMKDLDRHGRIRERQ